MKNLLMTLLVFGLILTGTIQAKPNVKSYGPIKSGETLWGIAYKTRPNGISRLQMMRAIHKMNPNAFEKGNINLLNKGVMLKIPHTQSLVRNVLSKESLAIAAAESPEDEKDINALKNQLQKVKDELKASREQLKGLQALKKDETNSTPDVLATTQKALIKTQSEVAALKEQNKRLLENSKKVDTSKVAVMEQELADTKDKLGALKLQNQLLLEKSANADTKKEQDTNNNNQQVSETIAALNADIGQLRTRIKELEEVEKLKDAHIAELKKSLDHASTVIKEQTEVNKKIFAQLNELREAKQARDIQQASALTVDNGTAVKPAEGVPSERETSAVQPLSSSNTNQTTTSSTEPPVTQAIQHISPKFWLILTLAGLLLVLALLWKLVAVKHDDIT
ncbi:MAG: Unknown protein [uncultured Thiotrichaceae bacterium]|uniref:LysM domain-containing protein n=1 Tax=uncultured Thiotrichaceae bacterium TaxID=298394 RepID=A0A6S6T311_9GAMM|nr:MAG: Unknown protein [uncultured Thiotrichaceae bacterium]